MNRIRLIKDRVFKYTSQCFTVIPIIIILFIFIGLLIKSTDLLAKKSLFEIIFTTQWRPLKGRFGLFAFIMGSLMVTGIAVIIAVPLSISSAIFLSEYSHCVVLKYSKSLIDVLSGIPSVIYGLWGVLIIVPFIKNILSPAVGIPSSGYSILSGGIVLSMMITPVMLHVSIEVLQYVSKDLREAGLSLGATRWQTIKHIVLRKSLPGIIAGVVLGLSRAFGETMAVMMVCGNVVKIPGSILDPGYPLPALIANNYGEMLSIPSYDSALILAAFILFIIVFVFNIISRIILYKIERSHQ